MKYSISCIGLVVLGAFLVQNGSAQPLNRYIEGPNGFSEDELADFVRDAFLREDEGQGLDTVDMGDHTIWLVHGPHAHLACVMRGIPPARLREELERERDFSTRRKAELDADIEARQRDLDREMGELANLDTQASRYSRKNLTSQLAGLLSEISA